MYCRLLIVDDEPQILNALRRELLRPPHIGTEGIEIETFASPAEALQRIQLPDGAFDAAIVDYHMPEIDGITLLEQLRARHPDTVRILLTGAIALDAAIEAVNSARIDYLLTKPWFEYDLKSRIALAVHQRQLPRPPAPVVPPAAERTFRLLLVDDQAENCTALAREISLHGRATRGPNPLFDIRIANSGAQALEIAAEGCPDLVIADYKMPGMDGIELLRRLRDTCPQAVRLLMSAFAGLDTVTDAINVAGVYHFLPKPWDPDTLRATLAQALSYRHRIAA